MRSSIPPGSSPPRGPPQGYRMPRGQPSHPPGRGPPPHPREPLESRRPPPRPEFIIIGLFALRLAKRLIEGLDRYEERDPDIMWLANFLAAYPTDYALARISGARMDDYVTRYPAIMSRFKKQPRYPVRFMQLNPDRRVADRALTDREALDIIDFADAAGEWGSVVKIPAHEADRMIALADRRRIAE